MLKAKLPWLATKARLADASDISTDIGLLSKDNVKYCTDRDLIVYDGDNVGFGVYYINNFVIEVHGSNKPMQLWTAFCMLKEYYEGLEARKFTNNEFINYLKQNNIGFRGQAERVLELRTSGGGIKNNKNARPRFERKDVDEVLK